MTHGSIYKQATFGLMSVYRRGQWARKERLPLYFVLRETDGHILEEFRRLNSAEKWAKGHANG